MRILLVEDEQEIAVKLGLALQQAGFSVDMVNDGETAWFQGDTESYSAVILDLGLPQMDGLTVLRRWRKAGHNFPVLILTARGEWSERVEGIDAGADDYLGKPFHLEELISRLRGLIRRSTGQVSAEISLGDAVLNTRQMRLTLKGENITLSPQEYKLLNYLFHHAGRVVSQTELAEQLYTLDIDYESNVIEVMVGRLRKKLGADFIMTQRGFGYFIHAEE